MITVWKQTLQANKLGFELVEEFPGVTSFLFFKKKAKIHT